MPIVYGAVGAPSTTSAADSSNLPVLQGKAGEFIVSELHGAYYTNTYRGNVFTASNATGGAVIGTATSTNCTCIALWNSSTTKNLEVISLTVTPLATLAVGILQLSTATGLGTQVGTGAPVISIGTALTKTNALVGGGIPSVATATTVISLTTAPLLYAQLGISIDSTTAGTGLYQSNPVFFYGSLILAPGSLVTLTANAACTAAASITWAEVPV